MSPGAVTALVSGSEIYDVQINVAVVPKTRWRAVCQDCTGAIDSLIELLQGRLSSSVMARLCEPKMGLFPSPKEIAFHCSCPDWASMCKHVAAVLYGVGARLDERPDLLFLLRRVNQQDLITKADAGLRPVKKGPVSTRVLDTGDLSQIFGIEIGQTEPASVPTARQKRTTAEPKPVPSGPTTRVVETGPKTAVGTRGMSATKRKAIAARMKAYWRERRKRAR
jgi:uncharacterized Zn finger protein